MEMLLIIVVILDHVLVQRVLYGVIVYVSIELVVLRGIELM